MPAPTIIDQSSAVYSTPSPVFTMPTPAGTEPHHMLIAWMSGIQETMFPPTHGAGWERGSFDDQLGGISAGEPPDTDYPGTFWSSGYLKHHAGDPVPASFDFPFAYTGDPTEPDEAHGICLAIDAGTAGSQAGHEDTQLKFETDVKDFGPALDTNHPPSLMICTFAGRTGGTVGVTAGFGDVVADEYAGSFATLIGAADTTGDAVGSNLGNRSFSGAIGICIIQQSEYVYGEAPPPTAQTRMAWGVLAK